MADKDQVVVFSGATLAEYDGTKPLRHWVDEITEEEKFTIGAFVGPSSKAAHIQGDREFATYTAGDSVRDYFTPGTYVNGCYQ